MKININLAPQKKATLSRDSKNFSSYTPLVALITVVIFCVVLFLQTVVLINRKRLSSYNKKWESLGKKYRELSSIKEQIADLESRKQELQSSAVAQYAMAVIFDNIFSSLPKNIWYDNLQFNDESINLNGYVVKWKEDQLVSLDKFIRSLSEKKYFSSKFSKINIKKTQKTNFNGAEVLQFTVECKK